MLFRLTMLFDSQGDGSTVGLSVEHDALILSKEIKVSVKNDSYKQLFWKKKTTPLLLFCKLVNTRLKVSVTK